MKCRVLGEFDNINKQIQEILIQSSKQIIGKLIHYYDQAVVDEHNFLRSLSEELATYDLPPNEQSEMENFEENISLKKEIIRTKLEKRRVTKIQKLLHPEAVVSKKRERILHGVGHLNAMISISIRKEKRLRIIKVEYRLVAWIVISP